MNLQRCKLLDERTSRATHHICLTCGKAVPRTTLGPYCSRYCFTNRDDRYDIGKYHATPSSYSCANCGNIIRSHYWTSFCQQCMPASVYVYEWYAESQKYPFYVGTGSRSRVLEPHMNSDRTNFAACELKRQNLDGKIFFRIIYQGLERDVAETIEYGLIKSYIAIGVELTNEYIKLPPFTNECVMSGRHIVTDKDYKKYQQQ